MTYRYSCSECGATYIGEQVVGKTCGSGHKMTGSPYVMKAAPLSDELKHSYSITEATKLRGELCSMWKIANKSHKAHGSNFSGNQTLEQLIQNIVEPVAEGAERERVKLLCIGKYQYDFDVRAMV
jgi:hypothetical protein